PRVLTMARELEEPACQRSMTSKPAKHSVSNNRVRPCVCRICHGLRRTHHVLDWQFYSAKQIHPLGANQQRCLPSVRRGLNISWWRSDNQRGAAVFLCNGPSCFNFLLNTILKRRWDRGGVGRVTMSHHLRKGEQKAKRGLGMRRPSPLELTFGWDSILDLGHGQSHRTIMKK